MAQPLDHNHSGIFDQKNGLLALDSRDNFQGGRTSLFLPPGAENPSYATAPKDVFVCSVLTCVQRIRGFTTMRYINLRFTYLLTYEKSHLTRRIALSCGIKISPVGSMDQSQSTRVTDGQTDGGTDGQTDRITTPKTVLA